MERAIEHIFNMMNWNNPEDVQAEGRKIAAETGLIEPFLQPLTPRYNKNVWDNCAAVLAEKSDGELIAYLPQLLEWLQDMNWPGAFCILELERLKHYSDKKALDEEIAKTKVKAENEKDDVWVSNLNDIFA